MLLNLLKLNKSKCLVWHHFPLLQPSNEYVTFFPLWKPCTFFSPTQKPLKTYRFEQHTFVSRRLAAFFATWRRQQFWLIFMKNPLTISSLPVATPGEHLPQGRYSLSGSWLAPGAWLGEGLYPFQVDSTRDEHVRFLFKLNGKIKTLTKNQRTQTACKQSILIQPRGQWQPSRTRLL